MDRDAADEDGGPDRLERAADVHARAGEQARGEPEPDRRVVVAAREDDLGAGVDEPFERVGEEGDGVGRRHRAVVDVAGDEDGVDPLGPDGLDEVVEEPRLGGEQPHLVERAAQVPVGGVDQAHTVRLGGPPTARWM